MTGVQTCALPISETDVGLVATKTHPHDTASGTIHEVKLDEDNQVANTAPPKMIHGLQVDEILKSHGIVNGDNQGFDRSRERSANSPKREISMARANNGADRITITGSSRVTLFTGSVNFDPSGGCRCAYPGESIFNLDTLNIPSFDSATTSSATTSKAKAKSGKGGSNKEIGRAHV